jgi:hypothetical protein
MCVYSIYCTPEHKPKVLKGSQPLAVSVDTQAYRQQARGWLLLLLGCFYFLGMVLNIIRLLFKNHFKVKNIYLNMLIII